MTETIDGLGQATTTAYDSHGNPTSVTDPRGEEYAGHVADVVCGVLSLPLLRTEMGSVDATAS